MENLPKSDGFPGHWAPHPSISLSPPLPPALPPPLWARHLREKLCLAQAVWQQEGEGAGDSEEEEAVHRAGKCCMLSSETASTPGRAENLPLAGAPSLGCSLASAAGAWSLKRAEWDEKHYWQSRLRSLWWKQLGVWLTKMQQQETNNPRGKSARAKPRLLNSLTLESNTCVGAADLPSDGFLQRPWGFLGFFFGFCCESFS